MEELKKEFYDIYRKHHPECTDQQIDELWVLFALDYFSKKDQKAKAVSFAEWIKLQNSTSRDLRLLVEYTGVLVWWYNGIVISESDLYDIFESDNGK